MERKEKPARCLRVRRAQEFYKVGAMVNSVDFYFLGIGETLKAFIIHGSKV
jgi:hypothetical protein